MKRSGILPFHHPVNEGFRLMRGFKQHCAFRGQTAISIFGNKFAINGIAPCAQPFGVAVDINADSMAPVLVWMIRHAVPNYQKGTLA